MDLLLFQAFLHLRFNSHFLSSNEPANANLEKEIKELWNLFLLEHCPVLCTIPLDARSKSLYRLLRVFRLERGFCFCFLIFTFFYLWFYYFNDEFVGFILFCRFW